MRVPYDHLTNSTNSQSETELNHPVTSLAPDPVKNWKKNARLMLFLLAPAAFCFVDGVMCLKAGGPGTGVLVPMVFASGGLCFLLWAGGTSGAYAKMKKNIPPFPAFTPSLSPKRLGKWSVVQRGGALQLTLRKSTVLGEMVFPAVLFIFMGSLGGYTLHAIFTPPIAWLPAVGSTVVVVVILAVPLLFGGGGVVYGIGQLIRGRILIFDNVERAATLEGKKHVFSDITSVELALKRWRKGTYTALQVRIGDETVEIERADLDDLAAIRPFGEYLANYTGLELIEVDDSNRE